MPATETPDQVLGRLDKMGLERVKALQARNHFEPKARGLVQGWINRREEALHPTPTPAAPEPDPVLLEALRTANKAAAKARGAQESAKAARRLALIAAGLGGAGLVVAILALFAAALR